jgi:hypothetical protein
MENIAAKKQAGQEGVGSDYLFADVQSDIPKITVTNLVYYPASPEVE